MKTFTLGELAVMKYGKLPPNSGYPIFTGYRVSGYAAECLYESPMLVVVARGVGGTGDVRLSPPRSWITNLSIVLDLDDRKADKQFMCYFLGQQSLKEKLNTGSAQAQITVNALSTFQVTIPALLVQRRIASILSAYDDLIENLTRRIAILEEMARRVYEEWFIRFRFPGHEGVRMVESELGLVPEGWRLLRLGELVEFQKGKKPAAVFFSEWAPGRAPALLIDALRGGSIEFAGANHLISVTRSDTIMVMDGSGSAQVFIGHEGVIGSTLRAISGLQGSIDWSLLALSPISDSSVGHRR